jgi:methylase of polypeptide subunit release factors
MRPEVKTSGADERAALFKLGQTLEQLGYSFTTVTPLTHARVNARPGNGFAEHLRDVFGWSRPFKSDVLDDSMLNLLQDANSLQTQGEAWRSAVRWSTLHGQLFVHSRFPTQEQDAVFFGPDSYRFIQALLAHLHDEPREHLRIADIGCGAGVGAIVAAVERPHSEVWALDINPQALLYTEVNAQLAGAANVRALHSNLLNEVEGEFDLIIANPPYMADAEQRAYRDGGGEHGAGLSIAIVEAALKRLAPGGSLLLYTGVAMFEGVDPFVTAVSATLQASRFEWQYWEMDPDVFGEELLEPAYQRAERIAAVVLRVTRP